MAGLIVPPMWGGHSARYHQTPPPNPQRWHYHPSKTAQHQWQREVPPIICHRPRIPHCTTEVRLFTDSLSSMIPRSPQTPRSETGSVCSSTSRQRSRRRGRQCDCGGVGGQGSVSVVVLSHETGYFDFRSLWRSNRSQISLNHCEIGKRRVHQSFCSWHHKGISRSHWIKSQEGLIRPRRTRYTNFLFFYLLFTGFLKLPELCRPDLVEPDSLDQVFFNELIY